MSYKLLTEEECSKIRVGEAVSVATIMTVACAIVMLVVIYKLYSSSKGSTTIPGGWKFTWN